MIRIFSQYVSLKSLLLVVLQGGLSILGLVCGARLRFRRSTDHSESLCPGSGFCGPGPDICHYFTSVLLPTTATCMT